MLRRNTVSGEYNERFGFASLRLHIAYCIVVRVSRIAYCIVVGVSRIAYCIVVGVSHIVYCIVVGVSCIAYCIVVGVSRIAYCIVVGVPRFESLVESNQHTVPDIPIQYNKYCTSKIVYSFHSFPA